MTDAQTTLIQKLIAENNASGHRFLILGGLAELTDIHTVIKSDNEGDAKRLYDSNIKSCVESNGGWIGLIDCEEFLIMKQASA